MNEIKRFACIVHVDELGGGMVESPTGPWVHLTTYLDRADAVRARAIRDAAVDLTNAPIADTRVAAQEWLMAYADRIAPLDEKAI